jgi:hypothetical protein
MFLGELLAMLFFVVKRAYIEGKEQQGLAIPLSPGTKQAE